MKRTVPPTVLVLLARLLLPARGREFILGDLEEMYTRRVARGSRTAAGMRYLRDLMASVVSQRCQHHIRLYLRPSRNFRPRRNVVDPLLHDVRMAVRSVVRARGTNVTIVLTLAVGIGTVSAFFSILNALLLRPLPYAEPNRLVRVDQSQEHWQSNYTVEPEVLRALREGDVPALAEVGAYGVENVNLASGDWTEAVEGARVSLGLLPLLGVHPMLGRLPGPGDAHTGSETVVLLGYDLWMRGFHGDPRAVGETIRVDGKLVQVIGVMPRGFAFPKFGEVWLPEIRPEPQTAGASTRRYAVARLAPGASVNTASRQLTHLGDGLAAEGLVPPRTKLSVAPGVYDRARGFSDLWIPFGAAALLLLIVCSNVASLLLARGVRRMPETSLRSALGASRGRLAGAALLEGTLLAAVGGALGLLLSTWILRAFLAGLVANWPFWFHPVVDGRVVAFTAAVTTLSVLIFALPPAYQGARVDPGRFLSCGWAAIAGQHRGKRLRRAIIVGEIVLATLLVVGSTLMALSARQIGRIDLGVDGGDAYEVGLSVVGSVAESDAAQRHFFHEVMRSIRTTLGPASSVSLEAGWLKGIRGGQPGSLDSLDSSPVVPEGGEITPGYRVQWLAVSPTYFRTVGLDIMRGRSFGPADREGAEETAVLSEAVAKLLWPHSDPGGVVGRTLRVGGSRGPTVRVVGVVQDQRVLSSPRREEMRLLARPLVYLAEPQTVVGRPTLVMRPPPGARGRLGSVVRAAVHTTDPVQAVRWIQPLDSHEVAIRRDWSAMALLLGVLAAVGAGLGAMGIYGIIAQAVAERTREIGVRTALGGAPERIVTFVVRDGLRVTLLGVVGGLAVSLLGTRLIRRLLYHVHPPDPVVLAGTFLAVLTVGWIASLVPARRAAQVDPMEALRAE